MDTDTISLVGLDKADVLRVLYNRARPQGMGFMQYTPEPMEYEEAVRLVGAHSYFDYLKGRVMKIDLSGDELDPRLYDRNNGQGAATEAITTLRSTGETLTDDIQNSHERQRRAAANAALEGTQEQSGPVKGPDGIATLQLGLGDVKDKLIPKLDKYAE